VSCHDVLDVLFDPAAGVRLVELGPFGLVAGDSRFLFGVVLGVCHADSEEQGVPCEQTEHAGSSGSGDLPDNVDRERVGPRGRLGNLTFYSNGRATGVDWGGGGAV